MFTRNSEEKLLQFYRHLDEKAEIPFHASWAKWLWRLFQEQEGWLVELKSLVGAYKGYLFEFNPKQLHDMISEAIRIRVPEVIKCMEWKGGNNDGTIDFA